MSPRICGGIRKCLAHGIAFAAFREADGEVRFICGHPDDQCTDSPFVVTPWLTGFASSIVIPNTATAEEIESLPSVGAGMAMQELPLSTCAEDYIAGLEKLIGRLQDRGGKTVISRTIAGCAPRIDWAAAASRMFDLFPNCFCHIYYHPACGGWMGATPELLLMADDKTRVIETMSLAGTKRPEENWDLKNREEQQIVTDFIADTLSESCHDINIGGVGTLSYNSIEHLCTRISAKMKPDTTIHEILDALSPTPAVSGFPREAALQDIKDIENAERRCYGGYVTVVDGTRYKSFVNLRCLQFSGPRYCIHAGGGVTPLSVPDGEWAEATAKATPLLDIINTTNCNCDGKQ